MSFRVPERYRLTDAGAYRSMTGDPFGAFIVPAKREGRILGVIACDGAEDPTTPPESWGWEHVSVSVQKRGGATAPILPTWDEMCMIKALFWEAEDVVVQFHPRASEYVNMAPVLHLWRYTRADFPTPHPILVG
jgi:hypothetical protein